MSYTAQIQALRASYDNEPEPLVRPCLPYLKDPKEMGSAWDIIKDSIGKDVTKLTVPITFNEPIGLIQKAAAGMEYNHIIEQAIQVNIGSDFDNKCKRMAMLAIYFVTIPGVCEKSAAKPFNPLLGETFEFENDHIRYLGE